MGCDPQSPLTSDEIAKLGNLLLGGPGNPLILLAVSGGVDSMALMHICARLVEERKTGWLLVATVDHGLRPESAEEARFVRDEAERIGLEHVTLVWEGEKPKTGIQAAARQERYRLLGEVYSRKTCTALLTAHTLDDQAETVLMRLARGSGVDGLSGIAPAEYFALVSPPGSSRGPMLVQRPLLHLSKERLRATMTAWGHVWREDPSNENVAFERVRLRQGLLVLKDLGIHPEALATSARRLRSAREALEQAAQRALGDPHLVQFNPLGYAHVAKAVWTDPERGLSEQVTLRVLSSVIRVVGGHTGPASLQRLEEVAQNLAEGWQPHAQPFATTIGRTKIKRSNDGVSVIREAGRDMPQPQTLKPGEATVWDNRFEVELHSSAKSAMLVQPLGEAGVKCLGMARRTPFGVPAGVLATLPSLWSSGRLCGLPPLPGEALADREAAEAWHNAAQSPWEARFLGSPSSSSPPEAALRKDLYEENTPY